MDGTANMNKQEIKELIDSIIERISNRYQKEGDEEIQIIIHEMKNGKFFPNESIEIIGSVDYCELMFGRQEFAIHFKDKDLYLQFCSGNNYSENWGDWKFDLAGYQVIPKEINITIYERVED